MMDVTIIRGIAPNLNKSVSYSFGVEPTDAEIKRRIAALNPANPTGKAYVRMDALGAWQLWVELEVRHD